MIILTLTQKNVHAYVIGEHGDSEMVPWSQAFVGTKSIMSIVENNPDRFKLTDLDEIAKDVTGAAQKIIEAKKATYYGNRNGFGKNRKSYIRR